MYFEITAVGFDGGTDETDDRVLWVSAPTRLHMDHVLDGVPFQSLNELDFEAEGDCLDYLLPKDDRDLRAALRAFAADLPTKEASE